MKVERDHLKKSIHAMISRRNFANALFIVSSVAAQQNFDAEREKQHLTLCIDSVDFRSNDADQAIKKCAAHSIMALRKFGLAADGMIPSQHILKSGKDATVDPN